MFFIKLFDSYQNINYTLCLLEHPYSIRKNGEECMFLD